MQEMEQAAQHEIIRGLATLSTQLKSQMSVWHTFRNGIIYGVGFIVGSTIITAFIVTIGLQFFGDTVFGDIVAWFVANR